MEKTHVSLADKHDRDGCLIEDIVYERFQLVHGSLNFAGTSHELKIEVQSLRPNKVCFLLKYELKVRLEKHFTKSLLEIFLEFEFWAILNKFGLCIL